MSSPWSSVMPGGVAFPRPEEDEEWESGDPGAPVADLPSAPAPEASTSVDDRPVPGALPVAATGAPSGQVGGLPVRPARRPVAGASLPVAPAVVWSVSEDAADHTSGREVEEGDRRGVLAPGQWLPPTTPDPDPDPDSASDAPVVPTTPVPVAPVIEQTPVPVAPVVEEPAAPTSTDPEHQPEVEVESEGVVFEGQQVDTRTGELTALDAGPVIEAGVEVGPQPLVPGEADLAGEVALPTRVRPVEDLTAADDWDPEELAAAEAEATRKRPLVSRAARPVAVTERDLLILQYLGRYRMATYPQIAGAFNASYDALRHRMPKLAREGLVVRKAVGKSAFSVWLPTDAGMKLANLDLPTPTLSWATVGHTLGLVDIGTRFEALGEVVVTEREIRAADTRDVPTPRMRAALDAATGPDGGVVGHDESTRARLFVVALGAGEGKYAHIPDMVLVRPPAENGAPRSVAIELELNHKPSAQWRKIMRAYKNAPHIGQVVYYTHLAKIRNGIIAAATAEGCEHLVVVRKFEPSEDSPVPLPGK